MKLKTQKSLRPPDRRWILQPVPAAVAQLHNLPPAIPCPPKEQGRVATGHFSVADASRWIEHYLEDYPGDAQADALSAASKTMHLTAAAITALGAGKNDEARAKLEELRDADPRHILATYYLAVIEGGAGNHARGLELLDSIESAMAADRGYLHARGNLLIAAGREADGKLSLRRAFLAGEFDEGIARTLINLGELIPVPSQDGKKQNLLWREDFAAEFRKAMIAHKDNMQALMTAAQRELGERRSDLALEAAKLGLEKMPDSIEFLVLAAAAGIALKDYAGAEAHLRKGLSVKADSAELLHNLSLVCSFTDRKDEALALNDRALADNPNLKVVMDYRLEKLTDEADRERVALELAKRFPESWAAHLAVAGCRARAKDSAGTVEATRKAFAISQINFVLEAHVAALVNSGGGGEEGVKVLDAVTNIHRRPPAVRWNVALLNSQHGRARAAEEIARGMLADPAVREEGKQRAHQFLAALKAGNLRIATTPGLEPSLNQAGA